MKHAIVGAGGVGGLLGGALAHSGESVVMVVRPGTRNKYPENLHVNSTFGKFDESVEWSESVPQADVVWLAVKALQLNDSVRLITEGARPQLIVPLLNGIDHVALIRDRFGEHAVVPGTIAVETERTAPGHIVHRSPFAKVNLSARGRGMLAQTMDQLRKIGFTGIHRQWATLMWGKLVFWDPCPFDDSRRQDNRRTGVESSWTNLQACVREACRWKRGRREVELRW
jgi:2-dehydropantoate 2-reductase